MGKTVAEADALKANIRGNFLVLPDGPAILPEWEGLVSQHNVLGKQAHDARIAAAMNVHGVAHLLTFNATDFARYPNVTALDPIVVAAGTVP